jgi:hypothetical protein
VIQYFYTNAISHNDTAENATSTFLDGKDTHLAPILKAIFFLELWLNAAYNDGHNKEAVVPSYNSIGCFSNLHLNITILPVQTRREWPTSHDTTISNHSSNNT